MVLIKSLHHCLVKIIKSGTKEPTQLKQIDLNEITKPLGIKLSRGDFISLIKDVVNNLDNKLPNCDK